MRSAKKYLVGLSTAAMVLGTIATGASVSAASQASSPAFSDISGNSAAAAITFLAQAGIINGTGNGQYSPSAPVTREQFAKIVVGLIGKGNVAAALQNVTPSFTDAASIDSWAWGYVNVAADMGIIKGYPDGSFKPNAPVSDVEASAMLIRAIGDDQPGIVNGTWPGNYVAAAYNLNLTNGVTFVANLPASRADIAQLSYNDAVYAPVAVAQPVGSTTIWCISTSTAGCSGAVIGTLYTNGSVNGFKAVKGTVTGVSSSNLWIGGTKYGWENNYQLTNIDSTNNLLGINVVALVDSSGNVASLTLDNGQSEKPSTGTLADGNTSVPSGFWRVHNAGDYLVSNNYNCGANGLSDTGDCNGNLYILLGGSTPTTVQLEGYTNANTQYIINTPSTGVNTDSNASVPDITYLNSTTNGGNADDDSVSYILDKNNKISTLYDTHVTFSAGLVTKTLCASGCDDTPANAGAQQNQIQINGTYYNVQSYTTLTLNGAAATLSKSLDNTVVYANLVGNGFNNDLNLTNVAMYNNTVTGTVTAITTSGSTVSSFTIQPANGSAQTLSTDSNFGDSAKITLGNTVTVALDSAGKVRAVISSGTSTTPAVALVVGTGSTQALGQTTATNTITVDNSAGKNEVLNVAAAWPTNTVYNSTYASTTAKGGTDGVILYVTSASGQAVSPSNSANAPDLLTADDATSFGFAGAAGDTLKVYSVTSNSAVLGVYDSNGNLDYSKTNGNPFVTIANGGAFKTDGTWLGLSGLATGKTIGVYQAPATQSGITTQYFVIISAQ